MKTLLIPVLNGIMPRPGGGVFAGGFFNVVQGSFLETGLAVFVCPLILPQGSLYRIGVLAKVTRTIQPQSNDMGPLNQPGLVIEMEGLTHARWSRISFSQGQLWVDEMQAVDFRQNRSEYPVVSGAGWVPRGGFTEFKNCSDIPVTIYGSDLQNQTPVEMTANLKGLVSLETAHTVEHAMIRSLKTYGLCSARTLKESMRQETEELTWSVEKSMQYALPELLGQTQSGSCGNPMTYLAHFYMVQELSEQIKQDSISDFSFERMRKSVMSRLTSELGLTTDPAFRALQGLKKGMYHDDRPLDLALCKNILERFPLEPWS